MVIGWPTNVEPELRLYPWTTFYCLRFGKDASNCWLPPIVFPPPRSWTGVTARFLRWARFGLTIKQKLQHLQIRDKAEDNEHRRPAGMAVSMAQEHLNQQCLQAFGLAIRRPAIVGPASLLWWPRESPRASGIEVLAGILVHRLHGGHESVEAMMQWPLGYSCHLLQLPCCSLATDSSSSPSDVLSTAFPPKLAHVIHSKLRSAVLGFRASSNSNLTGQGSGMCSCRP